MTTALTWNPFLTQFTRDAVDQGHIAWSATLSDIGGTWCWSWDDDVTVDVTFTFGGAACASDRYQLIEIWDLVDAELVITAISAPNPCVAFVAGGSHLARRGDAVVDQQPQQQPQRPVLEAIAR